MLVEKSSTILCSRAIESAWESRHVSEERKGRLCLAKYCARNASASSVIHSFP